MRKNVAWRRTAMALIMLAHFASAEGAFGCSFSHGYFHQVTNIKGRVVGRDLKTFGPLGYVRWLRQSFSASGARLVLYKYEWPFADLKKLVTVKTIDANASGRFDFGDVPEGHYFLSVKKGDLSGWFEVEVVKTAKRTKEIKIDISPVYPDCGGGHEFIVTTA